ncbi:MAG: hypothetical protein RLZZ450_3934, partial [Pseudomonadota bacterium]
GTREVERVVNDDSKSECVSGDAGGVTIDNASETDASRARPAAADGGREMDASLFVDAAKAKEAGEETEAAVLTADDAGDALTLADADSAETPLVPQAPACVPTAEMCDGHDNDCDGMVDQGVKTRCWADADGDGYAAAGAALVESCDACGAKQTAQEPVAGKADCDDADTKKSPGATDICGDKVDNDCDGKPDDDDNNACGGACSVQLPGKPGDACNNGQQGACARPGTYECRADHSMVCNAPMVPAAATEVCGNGKDDDCKNGVDDGCVKNMCGGWSSLMSPVGGSCMVVKGTCSYPSKYACAPGSTDSTVCGGEPPPESCDSKDNDCDDMVDEGFVTGGSCTVGKSECSTTGTLQCDRGAVACTAVAKAPATEVCGDGKDNDCNGMIDDGKNECGMPCGSTCPPCPGGVQWFPDCDNDNFSATATATAAACGTAISTPAPLSATCKGWTQQQPVAGKLDCNDQNSGDFPGAGWGLGHSDHNCDGVLEHSFWFIADSTGPNGRRPIAGCAPNADRTGYAELPCVEDPGANGLCSADWNDARNPDLQGNNYPPGHIVRLCQ